MKKISIIGSGFAGLALAFYLSKKIKAALSVYALPGNEGCASKVATGLLHPFCGPYAKKTALSEEGFLVAKELLASIPSKTPFYLEKPLFRPALYERQEADFKRAFKKDPQSLSWLEEEPYCKKPGIMVHTGIQLNAEKYLIALKEALINEDVSFHEKKILSKKELPEDSLVVWACGAYSKDIASLEKISLHYKRGQALKIRWPEKYPLPSYNLNGSKYLVLEGHQGTLGATYEEGIFTDTPDLNEAKKLILEPAIAMCPLIKDCEITGVKSGLRAHGLVRQKPVIEKIAPNEWVYTGLGSKGLLFHALFAKKLSEQILEEVKNDCH